MKAVLKYLVALIGASVSCVLIISVIALISVETTDEIIWSIWFIGSITLFYVFIGSFIWEIVFRVIPFKTWPAGGAFYFLFGVVYGAVAILIVNATIGEVMVMGWIVGMLITGVAAVVFYTIRKVSI